MIAALFAVLYPWNGQLFYQLPFPVSLIICLLAEMYMVKELDRMNWFRIDL